MRRDKLYPPDKEQKMRVKVELARRDMTVSDLARYLGMKQSLASMVVNGIRRSPATEEKIAAYLGLARKDLFKWGDRERKIYPPDKGRHIRARIELVRRGMTVGSLAEALGLKRGIVSSTIHSTRRVRETEEQIAAYLGVAWENLFESKEAL
jgi:transcriptional regulator with XRE-family HTH domain